MVGNGVQNLPREEHKDCDVSFSSNHKPQKSSALRNVEDPFNQISFGALRLQQPESCAESDNMFSIEEDKLKITGQDQDFSVMSSSKQRPQRDRRFINLEPPQ